MLIGGNVLLLSMTKHWSAQQLTAQALKPAASKRRTSEPPGAGAGAGGADWLSHSEKHGGSVELSDQPLLPL